MIFWGATGYNTLIMLGGLQGIPKELYDAASVDVRGLFRNLFMSRFP
jgi:cellobiose transport system permease protein